MSSQASSHKTKLKQEWGQEDVPEKRKMKNQQSRVLFLCRAAMIAALYTVFTLISGAMGLAGGVIQFRISDAFCIFGVFTPTAIPGVAVGCLISNFLVGGAFWDVVFGSLASLIGMLGVRILRRFPYIAPLPYVLANVIVVPQVLHFVYAAEGTIPYFMLTVGIGEVVCAQMGGVLLYMALHRHAKKLFV